MAPGPRPSSARRRLWMARASSALLALAGSAAARGEGVRQRSTPLTLYTFGDSILDCGRYNVHGVHPGQLLVRNDDRLFPEFAGRDLRSEGPARLDHRAVDGSTVDDLARQARGLRPEGESVAIVTVGGNDLLRGLAADGGGGLQAFEAALARFVRWLPVRPVVLGNVYDPTFGDDSRNFTGVPAALARANHRRVNEVIAELAARHGRLADLHRHFLGGDPSWFSHTIEPSLSGAGEVRRVFQASLGRA